MIQNMEDVAAMEFGEGLGKLIPDDQNLSRAWLAQYGAYQNEQGTYPGMSTGSASVQPNSSGRYTGNPMQMLPSLGQNAGMSMGPIGSMLPRLAQPGIPEGQVGMSMGPIRGMLPSLSTGTYDYQHRSLTDDEARAAARQAGGFGGTGRPGTEGQYRSGAMLPRLSQGPEYGSGMSMSMMTPAQVAARRQEIAQRDQQNIAQTEAFRQRMEDGGGMLIGGQLYQGGIFTRAKSSGSSRSKPSQQQQWQAPAQQNRSANQAWIDQQSMSQRRVNSIIASLMGSSDTEAPVPNRTPSLFMMGAVALVVGYLVLRKS